VLVRGVAAVPVPSDPAEPVVIPGAVFAVPALLVPADKLSVRWLPIDPLPELWA